MGGEGRRQRSGNSDRRRRKTNTDDQCQSQPHNGSELKGKYEGNNNKLNVCKRSMSIGGDKLLRAR